MENYINVTNYLKDIGRYNTKIIHNFLSLVRVKYFIGKEEMVRSERGRYTKGTFFREDLFNLFLSWMERKPIPLLNRKEYEINEFLSEYYNGLISQYTIGNYIFDWYIPSFDLLVEFNEKEHGLKNISIKDKNKSKSTDKDIFIINEKTALLDLARMIKKYPI